MLLLTPLLILLASFPIARTDYFLQTSRRMLWHGMTYRMDHEAGANCDVVIYGDSTAMTGLDPRVIEAETGLKTCNLALPFMTVAATGTMALDHYLAENRPPKFIVFANHVTHLRPAELNEYDGVIDGWFFVDRMYTPLRAAKFFLANPRYSFIFAADVLQWGTSLTESMRPDLSRRTYYHDMQALGQSGGFFELAYHEDEKQICHPMFEPPRGDARYFGPLKKYATAHTRVVFYISPVAECDAGAPSYVALAHALGIAAPMELPAADFADDRHLGPAGAKASSEELARLLRDEER